MNAMPSGILVLVSDSPGSRLRHHCVMLDDDNGPVGYFLLIRIQVVWFFDGYMQDKLSLWVLGATSPLERFPAPEQT